MGDDDEQVTYGAHRRQAEPLVEGLAAFTIVDPPQGMQRHPGDNCDEPWDYCCEHPETMKTTRWRSSSPTKKDRGAATPESCSAWSPCRRSSFAASCTRTMPAKQSGGGTKMYVRKRPEDPHVDLKRLAVAYEPRRARGCARRARLVAVRAAGRPVLGLLAVIGWAGRDSFSSRAPVRLPR